MAIKIITKQTGESLKAKSHWWGFPDLPSGIDFPLLADGVCDDEGEDLMTFICQIRLEEIAESDTENLLPHEGMLYFFADLDYFLGDLEAPCEGLGFWREGTYKVIYSPDIEHLDTHIVVDKDGHDACLPAESIGYGEADEEGYGHKLLGVPFFDEVREEAPGYISLLQMDEDERWNLRFYDCGMMNFLISREDLAARRFDNVKLYVHCM